LEDGWTFPIWAPPNDDGEIGLRIFIEEDGSKLSLRRISVFAIGRGQKHVHVSFIEASPIFVRVFTVEGKSPVIESLRRSVHDFLLRPISRVEDIADLIEWIFDVN
jgi:hypothetical protein